MIIYRAHYLALAIIFLAGLCGIFALSSNPEIQRLIVLGLALSYVGWGIFHQTVKKELTVNAVLEYVLLSVLAAFIVNALLI